jgi:hypothetical protein
MPWGSTTARLRRSRSHHEDPALGEPGRPVETTLKLTNSSDWVRGAAEMLESVQVSGQALGEPVAEVG